MASMRSFAVLSEVVVFASLALSQVDTAWVRTYDGTGHGIDVIRAIAFDAAYNIYATGESVGSNGKYDYALITYDPTGTLRWVRRFDGGANNDDYAKAVAVDKTGNVYVGGNGVMDLNSGYDFMIVKYAPNGDSLWTARYNGYGGSSGEGMCGMVLDDSGHVFVAGISNNSQIDLHDNFAILKYDSSGNLLRQKRGGASDLTARALARDRAGHLCVTGYATYSGGRYLVSVRYDDTLHADAIDFYLGSPDTWNSGYALAVDDSLNYFVAGYTVDGGTSCFTVIKYDAGGVRKWTQRCNGPGGTYGVAYALVVDAQGRVFATGTRAVTTMKDMFTVAISPSGDTLWTASYSSASGNSSGSGIALDSSGSVIVTGYDDSGQYYHKTDIVTMAYDKTGKTLWLQRYDSPAHGYDYGNAVAVDGQGNIYVAGQFGVTNSCDFVVIKYIKKAVGVEEAPSDVPAAYALEQNYPNPFNPTTTIHYALPQRSHVTITVYNTLGQKVAELVNAEKEAGSYEATFNASGLASGVYLYRIQAGSFVETRKLVLLR